MSTVCATMRCPTIIALCCIFILIIAACTDNPPHLGQANDTAGAEARALSSDLPSPTDPKDDVAFLGMWNYDPTKGHSDAEARGVLIIEGRCVYIAYADVERVGNKTTVTKLHDTRTFVSLPKAQTRYDPVEGLIWVGTSGPMRHGDIVALGGGHGGRKSAERVHGGACPSDDLFTASSMRPLPVTE